jgi:hypothetical protein
MAGGQRNGWESNGFQISLPGGSTMQEVLAVPTSNFWATSQTRIKRWFRIETTVPERDILVFSKLAFLRWDLNGNSPPSRVTFFSLSF